MNPAGSLEARRQEALQRLQAMGFELPAPLPSKGRYLPVRRCGDTLWVSGHTGRGADGARTIGVVGADVGLEEARNEARRAAVNLLAAVDGAPSLGAGLGNVEAVLHLRVYVRAVPEFLEHPAVADAASDLLYDTLGAGVGDHARTAVGVASLPGGAPVELEAVLALAGG